MAARIKKLGGQATSGPQLPGVPTAVGEVAGKAVAAVKGQVGTARAVVTQQAETHLRNAQEELREEHVEIAIYSRIAKFAEEVGDRETAQLAKAIRRDEERMAKFLDAELERLVKEVVRAEIPRDQRAGTTRPAGAVAAQLDAAASTTAARRTQLLGTQDERRSTSGRRSASSRSTSTSSRIDGPRTHREQAHRRSAAPHAGTPAAHGGAPHAQQRRDDAPSRGSGQPLRRASCGL